MIATPRSSCRKSAKQSANSKSGSKARCSCSKKERQHLCFSSREIKPQLQQRNNQMKETNTEPQPRDLDAAIRKRVIERAMAINTKLLAPLATVADDLDVGGHRAALGGLDGIERQIDTMRSFLLLLS